jgi:hypothetical protein
MLTSDYATWAAWLEAFARGEDQDASHLPPMRGEELGGDAAQRFAARCGAALDARLKLWLDGLQRDIGRSRDHADLRLALIHARTRLAPIRRFAESQLLFPELRATMTDAVRDTVQQLQDELLRQTSGPGDDGVLRQVVRDVPLLAAVERPIAAPPIEPEGATPARRPILISKEHHG